MTWLENFKMLLDIVKLWANSKLNPLYLQWLGVIGIIAAYVVFGIKYTYTAWAIMAIIGLDELLLMWCWNKTITAFARTLLPKTIDLIILFAMIPLTWWWFNPQSAGMLLMGLLLNHFTETQPK